MTKAMGRPTLTLGIKGEPVALVIASEFGSHSTGRLPRRPH